MFDPKKLGTGAAVIYCAQCILMRTSPPKQAVTIFSGTAYCPTHLGQHPKFQFLRKGNLDDSFLEVR